MEIINIGLDMGNKNMKVCGISEELYEFPVAYERISEFDYENETTGMGVYNVKYLGEFFRVGNKGITGLPKNKGDIKYRNIANMLKLTALAIDLKRNNLKEGTFNVVTGTPIEDHLSFKKDYEDLFISNKDDFESIEINKEKFNIKVNDVFVAKQCSVAKPLIPNIDNGHVLFMDWGGGTLDIAYYIDNTLADKKTIKYPLNETLERLGYELKANGIGIDRPNAFDSTFLKEMEQVVLEGRYLATSTIKVGEETIDIKEFANEYLKEEIEIIINDVVLKFGFSDDLLKVLKVIHFGGGAKLLRIPLSENNIFNEKMVVDKPEFLNVLAYGKYANLREW